MAKLTLNYDAHFTSLSSIVKICPLYHSGLESKQESQETPGQTGSLDLVYKMKQGKD